MDSTKRCSICQKDKPATLEHFYKSRLKSGLSSDCKECRRAKKREIYYANHEQEKARLRENYYKHQDDYKAKSWAYEQAHRERYLAHKSRNHKVNRERERRLAEIWRKNNPEKYKQLTRGVYERRSRRMKALPNTLTEGDWERALAHFSGCCAYCGNPPGLFKHTQIETDHFIAIADPRPDNPGTVPDNILPACGECNMAKGNMDPEVWLLGRFGERQARNILNRIQVYFTLIKCR